MIDATQPKAEWENGKRVKWNTNEVEVKALHVEVVSGTEIKIRTMLAAMYSKQNVTGPDDEKMRFSPSPDSVQHSQILQTYGDIIRRQAWFSAGIVRIGSNELININSKSDHLPKSLRKMIMEMRTTYDNPMFIALDKYWDKSVSFVFPKKYEREARNRVADLGSYLRHKYGDQVLIRHFTPAAAARAVESPWNPELGRVETPMNKELEFIMNDCNDINWLTAPASAAPTFEFALDLHSSPLFNSLPNDDDSLESFRQQGGNTLASPPAPQQHTPTIHLISPPRVVNSSLNDTIAEDLTEDGNHTITSLASRMSLIENSLAKLRIV